MRSITGTTSSGRSTRRARWSKTKEYLLANLWREPGVKPNEKQKARAEEVLKKHPHEPFNLKLVPE
jgi:hypothetical protein